MKQGASHLRCAIYARVATSEQTQEDPFAQQLEETEAHALSRGYGYFSSHIYTEFGSGNSYKDRSRLKALLEAGKQGEFDVLIVRSYDRLSRVPEQLAIVLATLYGYGIQVESVTEAFPNPQVQATLEQLARELHAEVDRIEREKLTVRAQYGRKTKKASS